MKRIALYFILTISITTSISAATRHKNAEPEATKDSTQNPVPKLKTEALLVRLKTKKYILEGLRKMGRTKQAHNIEQEQAQVNKQIISAFKTEFDFCPVYFFHSDDSKAIKEKKFDNILFLNDSLLPDSNIRLKTNSFLIAEFGTVSADTIKQHDNYSMERNYIVGEKQKTYNGAPDMGFSALVIKNDQFFQLKRPFPFYVRTFSSFPIKRKTWKVVKKMNEKLHKYYGTNTLNKQH